MATDARGWSRDLKHQSANRGTRRTPLSIVGNRRNADDIRMARKPHEVFDRKLLGDFEQIMWELGHVGDYAAKARGTSHRRDA